MNNNFQDFFLSCKECILENPRSFYGSFSIGPFKNSQSLTIANALRRTLLTEISNIAITSVEIEGVLHEYSTIEGVRESVLDILLNFKQVVLKTSFPFTKPLYGYLNVRGPGIIRVSDLKLPPSIQYVDPDQYIATLNENGNLSLKFTISDFCNSSFLNFSDGKKEKIESELKSQSFTPLIQHQKDFRPLTSSAVKNKIEINESTSWEKRNSGVSSLSFSKKINSSKTANSLWVDPNFNPILKVNYLIENLEPIGHFQNQIIHIEIWTNGSLHPRKALYFTFDFLRNIFNKFEDMKYINSQFNSQFFKSEESLIQILKTYEYDFGFYELSSLKNLKIFSDSHSVLGNHFSQKLNIFHHHPQSGGGETLPNINTIHTDSSQNKKEKQIVENNQVFYYTPSPFVEGEGREKNSLLPIQKLHLPFRITNCLIQNNLKTVEDLLIYSPKELQTFCGIGNFSLSLIQKKLKKIGFVLRIDK
jgi:DNA-directed RNA polymerase alpha subunit